jgi:LysM repeat protein
MDLKKTLFFLLIGCCSLLHAQDKLVAMGISGDRYVIHTVAEKESLSAIGRMYGFTPRQLAQYNGLSANAVLPSGARMKIQLTPENLNQQADIELGIPVYHIAQKGDNLFRLSQQYYKVPVASMRLWNDLKTDIVKGGQAIIVGYIISSKTKQPVSAFSKNHLTEQSGSAIPQLPALKKAASGPPPLKNTSVMDALVDGARELKGEMKPLNENELRLLAAAQERVKKEEEAAANLSVPLSGFSTQAPTDEIRIADVDIRYSPKQNDEGFFSAYNAMNNQEGSPKEKGGNAAVFKSLSGFNDRKFYVLMNEALPGTIIRISAANKKTICARVLGALPETKGSEGLLLRMSNAASAALGITENIFSVNITYYQ